jgi:isoquinoline 1-oxidoreductase
MFPFQKPTLTPCPSKDLPSAGAGESPLIAVAPAIGNALFHATRACLRSLPIVPNGFKAG